MAAAGASRRIGASALACLTLLLRADQAEAHLVSTGFGPVYDGIAHFGLTLEDLVPVLGLALLGGLRGPAQGRAALLALPIFWLAGGIAGQLAGRPAGELLTAASFLAVGGLVAADAPLAPWAVAMLTSALAAERGYANGSALPADRTGLLVLLGSVAAASWAFALATAIVLPLRSRVARTAVRACGSWIAAAGLLVLGWSLRRGTTL
jgi:urease accessory protein